MKKIKLEISDEMDGKIIKDLLHNPLEISSRLITKLKSYDDGILLNGIRVTVRKEVHKGDILELNIHQESSDNIIPKNIPIDIVYEDAEILVVNKPFNMPTHPSIGNYENTLANAVMYYYRDTDFVFRAVNRLDRDTTGLVLIAKNQYSANKLSSQIKNNEIKKVYLAICEGRFSEDEGTIEENILREKTGIIKRIVSQNGQYAKTDYKVLAYKDGYSLVEVYPKTGRTHQIRVHFSYIGHPLYSDFLYGSEILGERTRLHCHKLSFLHPETGEKCTFVAPAPNDFFIS